MIAMMISFGIFGCFGALIGLLVTIFWIWMIVDALLYEPTTRDKVLWFLVILLLHGLGALLYFLLRRPSRPSIGP